VSKESIAIEPNLSLGQAAYIQQSHLSQFIQVINHAVWIVDNDLHLVAQNKAACDMMGWPFAGGIGSSLQDLIPSTKQSLPELCQLISRAIETGQQVSFDQGLLLARKKARPLLIRGNVVPLLQADRAIGAICAFWEIFPEKDDTYLKFEFANMASHLMRTPLSFIQASIEFLMNSELEAEEQRAMLGRMWFQSQRLTTFTNELLKMLRLEVEDSSVHIEAVALLPLVERVLKLVQHEHPRHIFKLQKTASFPVVAADPVKIELILLNLLLNSIRRCPNGGHVSVEVKECDSEIITSVTDDGEAIPAELLDKVFWQFYPVDGAINKMPSTYNLGLYNTKKLVELQHGRTWVESQPGQDPQFSFSLPIWEQSK
jgi:signal transduction histidine kinase